MRRLAVHVLLYGLVLAAVAAVVPLRASFGSDDGAYGGQVYALRHGGWVLDRPVPVVDGANEGWLNASVKLTGPVPYSANPAYVRLLAAVARVVVGPPTRSERGGDLSLALHLPGLVAALVSAAVAWRLASSWDRRAAPLAFWILALGPLLVDTTALWAHPLGTAAAGTATLALAELWHRPTAGTGVWRWRLVFALALTAGAVVRTEAVFWTLALVATALGVEWSRREPPGRPTPSQRRRATVATALGGGMVAGLAWAVNRAWGRSIRAPEVVVRTGVDVLEAQRGWLGSRLPAAWQLLATWPGRGWGSLLPLVAALLVAWAAVHLRREAATGAPLSAPVAVALLAAAGLHLAKAALAPAVVIPGIVAAWPLVAVALVAWPAGARRRRASTRPPDHDRAEAPADLTLAMVDPTVSASAIIGPPADRPGPGWLLVPAALMTGAVLITQYAESGGLQWGGRYLSMAYVPLAAAAGISLVPIVARASRLGRVALAGLLLAPAVGGVATAWRLHTTHAAVVGLTTRPPAEVVVTDLAALPRIAWTELPTAYYLADADTIGGLLDQLAAAGVRTVDVAGLTGTEIDGLGGYTQVTTINEPRGTVRHLMRW